MCKKLIIYYKIEFKLAIIKTTKSILSALKLLEN